MIPPLQTIEDQMTKVCSEWNISCMNISKCPTEDIGFMLSSTKPRIIIASIEKVNDYSVQKQLVDLKLCYIAVDEAQVTIFFLSYFDDSGNFAQSYPRIQI